MFNFRNTFTYTFWCLSTVRTVPVTKTTPSRYPPFQNAQDAAVSSVYEEMEQQTRNYSRATRAHLFRFEEISVGELRTEMVARSVNQSMNPFIDSQCSYFYCRAKKSARNLRRVVFKKPAIYVGLKRRQFYNDCTHSDATGGSFAFIISLEDWKHLVIKVTLALE